MLTSITWCSGDAVDAYERKLVKQIEIASLEVEGGHNKAYVRFISASNGKVPVTARVEIDVLEGRQVRRKEMVVQDGDDLQELTKRAIYADCRIGEIRAAKDRQLLEVKLPGSETFLQPGQVVGDVDADALKRLMIRRTIQEHLERKSALRPSGSKCSVCSSSTLSSTTGRMTVPAIP
jgi:type III restriction enzyme